MTPESNSENEFACFDLTREITDAAEHSPWAAGHFAKTLFKSADFRVVLICMEPAAKLKEHHAAGTISVQVLSGAIRFVAQGQTHDLRSGQLLTLGPAIPHAVEAVGDCAFLLTIALL